MIAELVSFAAGRFRADKLQLVQIFRFLTCENKFCSALNTNMYLSAGYTYAIVHMETQCYTEKNNRERVESRILFKLQV